MTTSATTPSTELDDLALYTMAEDLLDALLTAADVDTIGATNWWERAKTALETAAGASDSWRQCVARAARKLQIEAPSHQLATITTQLAAHLDNPVVFHRWARLAERDALAITALVRERRTTRRSKTKPKPETNQTKPKPTQQVETQEELECLPF